MTTLPETPEALFLRVLEINQELAASLVISGFTSLEEIAYLPLTEFLALGILEEQQVQALRMRARSFLHA